MHSRRHPLRDWMSPRFRALAGLFAAAPIATAPFAAAPIATALSCCSLVAQSSTLVVDFEASRVENESQPGSVGGSAFYAHGPYVYFPATTAQGRDWFRMPRAGDAVAPTRRTDMRHHVVDDDSLSSLVGLDANSLLFTAAPQTNKLPASVTLFALANSASGVRAVAEISAGVDGRSVLAALTQQKRVLIGTDVGVWVSDGSSAGTGQLFPLKTSSMHVTSGGKRAFIVGMSASNTVQLWVTDASSAGTRLVRDFRSGQVSGGFASVGQNVIFRAFDLSLGYELWSTDGTPSGTRILDLYAGSGGGALSNGVALQGRYWFVGNDGTSGPQLWSTDGTVRGSRAESKLASSWNSIPAGTWLVAAQNRLWFSAKVAGATTLHVYDPATKQVRALPAPSPQAERVYEAPGGAVHVICATTPSSRELWATDGTPTGTRRLAALPLVAPLDRFGQRAPGSYLMEGSTSAASRELYTLDPGKTAVRLVADSYPGTSTASSRLGSFFPHESRLWFVGDTRRSPGQFWSTDGRQVSTRSEFDASAQTDFVRVGDATVFSGYVQNKSGLWALAGRMPQLVAPLSAYSIARIHGQAVLAALQPASNELWTSDGSTAGTRLMFRLPRPALGPAAYVRGITEIEGSQDFLFYYRNRIYRSDGTSAGTKSIASVDIPPESEPETFARTPNGYLFAARDAARGTELWITGASNASHRLLLDICPGAASSTPSSFTEVGGKVFFTASSAAGRELWVSDGSVAGTRMVIDIQPGSKSSAPAGLMRVGRGEIVFSASIPLFGRELIRSDGSVAGTRLVANLNPHRSSHAQPVQILDGQVYALADDGRHGRELHRVGVGGTSLLTSAGCSGVRRSSLDASAPRIGRSQIAESEPLLSGAASILILATPRGSLSTKIGSCTLAWDLAAPLWIVDAWTTGSGSRRTTIPVPRDPRLVGARYALQTATLSTTLTDGFGLSNGVECVIGS